MGLLIPSLYVDHFHTSISNVYVSVGQSDVTVKNKPIDPYKGFWIYYNCGVWANQTLREKQTPFITQISNTIPYDSTIDVVQQVYNSLKKQYPDATDC